jgi:hypothetical protein
MMSLDSALWLAYVVAESVVFGLLLYRRVWRKLPIFCVYCAWDMFSNAGSYVSLRLFPASYLSAYLGETVADIALQFTVLLELAWSVLRPLRASLPNRTLVVIGALIVAVGAAIWPFAAIPGLVHLSAEERILVRLQQTASILRVLFFLVLAGCSQLLSIGWRDRELQVATGLGFYSLAGIAVAVLNTRPAMGLDYALLNQFVVASYLCSLLYWVFSFVQKEAARREFTPQMQNFLLTLAGAAHTSRVALANAATAKTRKREEP